MAIKISELTRTEVEVVDDRCLVVGFKAGDVDAYAMIYRRYYSCARGVSLRILRNPEDADEAAQETMFRVLQALPRFNGRYELRAWIARIATNVSLDMVRSGNRRTRHFGFQQSIDLLSAEDQLDRTGEDPSETVERMVQAHRVRELLGELPVNHRDALVLRELQGRSHQEIADELGMTPPQVKALIHRAKGSFRRLWDAAGDSRIAGVLLFLIPQRFAGGLRRIADHAGDAGRSAAASPTMTAVASSPAVQAAASETGQKVAAAAMTILVAGTLTAGGIGLARHRAEPSPAAPQPAQVIVPAPVPDVAPIHPTVPIHKTKQAHHNRGQAGPGSRPDASGSPTPEPSDTPTPGPTESPPPGSAGDPPPPVLVPPPAWSGQFGIDWTSQDQCGCGSGISAGVATTSGQIGDNTGLEVHQSFQGAALDAEGDAAWALSAEYQAHLQAGEGNVTLTFFLGSGPAKTQYVMTASSPVVQGTPADGNSMDYTFTGTYTEAGANADSSPIPVQGSATLHFSVWGDGTSVYAVTFQGS